MHQLTRVLQSLLQDDACGLHGGLTAPKEIGHQPTDRFLDPAVALHRVAQLAREGVRFAGRLRLSMLIHVQRPLPSESCVLQQPVE
jgi:hypothetical protein